MKDIWIDTLLKIICVALILALAFGAVYFCKSRIEKETKIVAARIKAANCRQLTNTEEKEVNRLFRKHGDVRVEEGKEGKWYFWRDRQWCKFQ